MRALLSAIRLFSPNTAQYYTRLLTRYRTQSACSNKQYATPEEIVEKSALKIPIGRSGEPLEFTKAAVFSGIFRKHLPDWPSLIIDDSLLKSL